ncbi:MAG: winged helix-turn-helix domain-containing protein, partial [Blastocatellia bacterium]
MTCGTAGTETQTQRTFPQAAGFVFPDIFSCAANVEGENNKNARRMSLQNSGNWRKKFLPNSYSEAKVMTEKRLYTFGAFQLDPQQKILLRDGERIPLHPKTFATLLALLESSGAVITKDDLLAKVWPDTFVEESSLTKNIALLRKALRNGHDHSDYIETIPTIGYRFVELVRHKAEGDAPMERNGDAAIEVQVEVTPTDEANPVVLPAPRRFWLWGSLVLLLIAGLSLVWWLSPRRSSSPAVDEFAPVRLTHHVAVDWYPSYSPDGRQIAFVSNREGQPVIYLMNADGGEVRKLVNNLPDCSAPAWSSDGTKLYFYSAGKAYVMNADGSNLAKIPDPFGQLSPDGKKTAFVTGTVPSSKASHEIAVANIDGSSQVRLTNNHSLDADPFWSPDGKHIAFTCFPDGFVDGEPGNPEVCVMNADGSDVTRLTNNPAEDNSPLWSPDGTRIAFFSRRNCKDGTSAIHVMNADGSNAMRLTECQIFGAGASWSPDSRKLLYTSNRDGNIEIYAINTDPSHQTNITKNLAEDSDPGWSHDGRHIAFISNREGRSSLFVMDADGGNQRKLVIDIASRPSWSPDDRRIAFGANWAGNLDVYVANADGSGIVQLTHTPANEDTPVWSPDGAKILFCSYDNKINQLFVMSADGNGVTRISNSPEHEGFHDWSPDGKQIVFTRSRNRSVLRDLWMMNADGSSSRLIAAAPGNDEFLKPCFSPDGRHIAFHRRVASPVQTDVWVMRADGSEQTRLTYLGGGVPAWSPEGKKLAFQSYKRTGNSEIYVMTVK